jgi:hypothetical protein
METKADDLVGGGVVAGTVDAGGIVVTGGAVLAGGVDVGVVPAGVVFSAVQPATQMPSRDRRVRIAATLTNFIIKYSLLILHQSCQQSRTNHSIKYEKRERPRRF